MQTIMVLEDSLERIEQFKAHLNFPDVDVHYFDNVRDAKAWLKAGNTPGTMFLDHDLDQKAFVCKKDPNTGYQLAKWMKENNIECPQIIIHSLNPVGVDHMYEEVKNLSPDVRKIPFYSLFKLFNTN